MQISQITTYASVATGGAGAMLITLPSGGPAGIGSGHELVGAVLVALAAGLLLRRLWFDPETRPLVERGVGAISAAIPSARTFGAVLMCGLAVTAAAGGGWLGPGAQQSFTDVSPVGEGQAFVVTATAVAVGVVGGVLVGRYVDDYMTGDPTTDIYASADKNETIQEVEQHAKTIATDEATLRAVLSNQINDGSRSVAWAKAKLGTIRALNNNKSKATAKAWAMENVTDYYSTMEYNLVNQQADEYRKIRYLNETYNIHSELNAPFRVHFYRADGTNQVKDYTGNVNGTYTLLNGTNVSAVQVTGNGKMWATMNLSRFHPDGGAYFNTYDTTSPITANKLQTAGDETSYDTFNVSALRDYYDISEQITSANSQMRSNAGLYVDNVYSQYQAGDINTTDLVDPTVLAQEMATDYNSTGYYAYAGADLAIAGISGDLNKSVTIEQNGTYYNGSLYSDWEPSSTSGKFEVGHTYNTSNANASVFVATNDGLVRLGREFTVKELTNIKTGESVNSTDMQNYNRQTQNTTLTMEQLKQLINIRKEINEQEAAAAGGGGCSFFCGDGSSVPLGVIALVALGGAVLLLDPRD